MSLSILAFGLQGVRGASAVHGVQEDSGTQTLNDREGQVRILEPGAADTSTVNIGVVIHFERDDGEELEPITILGVWDADVDSRIFANGSDLAQRMLGKTPGDAVEIDGGSAIITRIEPWKG